MRPNVSPGWYMSWDTPMPPVTSKLVRWQISVFGGVCFHRSTGQRGNAGSRPRQNINIAQPPGPVTALSQSSPPEIGNAPAQTGRRHGGHAAGPNPPLTFSYKFTRVDYGKFSRTSCCQICLNATRWLAVPRSAGARGPLLDKHSYALRALPDIWCSLVISKQQAS